MRYWCVSDTHFGHKNMVQYCGRPDDFSEILMKNLSMIPEQDVLIHLGDICIGNDAEWHKLIDLKIKCRKILVRGNHDSKTNEWYMTHGWDFVCEKFVLNYDGQKVVFSHQPTILERNDWNIHGHFHNQLNRLRRKEWVVEGEEERNHYVLKDLTVNHVNISMEETDYQAVPLWLVFRMGENQRLEWQKQ